MADGRIILSDGIAEVEIEPGLGAGIARYNYAGPNGRIAMFRPAPDGTGDPFALGCNLLAPWSNRISGGGFTLDGTFHALQPNWPGEPFPIHGNAFSAQWTALDSRRTTALLALDSDGPGPFRYRAEVNYGLDGGALTVDLRLTSSARFALPYGLGIHPWLPRTPRTTLLAPAQSVWLEDARHLPSGCVPVGSRPDWDFRTACTLPSGWINNAFTGWTGYAEVSWPERGLGLRVAATPSLSTCIIYSPGEKADFFCFEPVTHPVDAFNLPGGHRANGLEVLQPGETLRIICQFKPFDVLSEQRSQVSPLPVGCRR